MNDSTDLRKRIMQMREANDLNLGIEKSEYVDQKIIPKENIALEDNVIDQKENFKSSVTNDILTPETDVKSQSLLNKKKSLVNEAISNKPDKEKSIKFSDSNEIQFRILATKFNEAVEVILELSDKVNKLEQKVYKTSTQIKKENSFLNYINIKMLFILTLLVFLTLGILYFPFDLSTVKLILNDIASSI